MGGVPPEDPASGSLTRGSLDEDRDSEAFQDN